MSAKCELFEVVGAVAAQAVAPAFLDRELMPLAREKLRSTTDGRVAGRGVRMTERLEVSLHAEQDGWKRRGHWLRATSPPSTTHGRRDPRLPGHREGRAVQALDGAVHQVCMRRRRAETDHLIARRFADPVVRVEDQPLGGGVAAD
jgi:hypothetical protein